MSRILTPRRSGIIILCLILTGIGIFFGRQKLSAQSVPSPMMMPGAPGGAGGAGAGLTMPPGMPGMGGQSQTAAPAAPAAPTGPVFTISKIARGIQAKTVKNWDGSKTKVLRFKYQLEPKRVITVHLPEALAKEKRTKEGWATLFQVFSMDYEAKLDAEAKNKPVASTQSSGGASGGMMGMPMMGGMPGGMPGLAGGMGGGMPMLPSMPVR
ncbi:MAG: hypothetical protein ACYC27_05370 [Armatimonadota bacterium]